MKVGLALSGGGARAIAHLGMMKVLDEQGIKVDRISGASAGALLGALYANGYSADEIFEMVRQTNFFKIVKPALTWTGLLKLEGAYHELNKYLPDDHFESLKVPLIISATDIRKGKIKYFKKGQLIRPILASCSIPVVFDPITINGISYMDGGIMDNLPIQPLKKKCDFIIGMHCNPIDNNFKSKNWKGLMERALLLSISSATYQYKKKFDVFWEAPEVSRYNVFDFKKAEELYKIGYAYASEKLEELMPLMQTV
jgi:NTE family protein